MKTSSKKDREPQDCLTLRVDDCAEILGVGLSTAYTMVRNAEAANGEPFKVLRVGSTLLVSKKSFSKYLEDNGL